MLKRLRTYRYSQNDSEYDIQTFIIVSQSDFKGLWRL